MNVDWLGDYVSWCSHSLGGLMLLGITCFCVLLAVLGVLAGVAQLSRAFARGWRSVG